MNPFEESAFTIILVAEDLELSKKFYLDILGAKLFREYGGDSIVFNFLGQWILIVKPGGPTPDKPGISFVPLNNKNDLNFAFTIRVKDCQKSYKILKERGVKFITPPQTRGAETRCFFKDPDGYLFEISEYRSGA